ncbi:hypothetical protein [Reinekea sp.]|jgi:hypothetical protein|uniref:hypothetical protein n=1 Tax=Reinekea sp. TaxID=1970455 RepID=UPI003989374A
MTKMDASLHLYGSNGLLGHLKNGRLPLSQGDSMLNPYLETGLEGRQTHAPIPDHEIEQEMKRQYESLPSHISALLGYEDYKKQSEKLMPSIIDAIQLKRKGAQADVSDQYNKARFAKVSYLRLFNSAKCHFGWETLANNFTGMCIELKANHEVFSSNQDRLALIKPVGYGATHDFQVSAANPIPGFFMDCEENAPRQEWRAAFLFKEQQQTLKLASAAVKHIYLSANATAEDIDAVKRFVSQDIRFRHVGVSLVLPDEQRWRLRVKPL